MEPTIREAEVVHALEHTIRKMRLARPNDRSEIDRRFAIAITQTEQALAYFYTFVASGEAWVFDDEAMGK